MQKVDFIWEKNEVWNKLFHGEIECVGGGNPDDSLNLNLNDI